MALPGVTTILKDQFYSIARSNIPAGPRVVAIATRDTANNTGDVKDYDTFSPRTGEEAKNAFGEDSGAYRAWLELLAGGASRITIVPLPATIEDTDLYDTDVFESAFGAAESVRPDIIVPWGRGGHPSDWEVPATPGNDVKIGYHVDNISGGGITNNLAKKVADRCQLITERSNPCFAVMGVKPYTGNTDATPTVLNSESMTATEVSDHLNLADLPDRGAVPFGLNGQYLTVVAAEMRPVTYHTKAPDWGYSNGAAIYAGYLSQLDSWTAATGKQIYNINQIRYNPTRTQQEALIAKGITPVATDFNNIPTWVDAQTFSKADSDYTRLSTLRIVFDAVQAVRSQAQKFIGEPSTLHNRNALDTAVTSVLRGMKTQGALLDGDHEITYLPRENKAIIDLVLRPAFELRNIEISVSIQF
ncbi:MAG TPA: hypothetical protein VJ742_12235 [Nitrososphaera sp.]|nr:hypothetical protein [Nitrososphaera sp.]